MYSIEGGNELTYDFVPYKYGAFSYTCYADIRKLIELGFIQNIQNVWQITKSGRSYVGNSDDLWLRNYLDQHQERGDDLMRKTYVRYPYFAQNSVIAEKILSSDQITLKNIRSEKRNGADKTVFTIGYEGLPIESYINRLIQSGVTILVDVRRNPISRKYGFSKSILSQIATDMGIVYLHIPELGIASSHRMNLIEQEDYDRLFEAYSTEWLPSQGDSINKLINSIDDGQHLAITCYEKDYRQCHRSFLAIWLRKDLPGDYRIEHL